MDTTFTPGPWIFIDAETKASECYSKQCIIRGAGKQIAAFSWQTPSRAFPSREESKANARLIAAAPELFEALFRLTSVLTSDPLTAYALTMFGANISGEEMADVLLKARAAVAKASGMSAFGQDPKGLEAKPASPVPAQPGDAR